MSLERKQELTQLCQADRDSIAKVRLKSEKDAFSVEVCCHIADEIGYEVSFLSDDQFALHKARCKHEFKNSDPQLLRPSACRAFTWLVRLTGAEEYGMADAQFLEWIPTDEYFAY